MALILLIPGALAFVLTGLIPWLLETHHRLDNSYWEFQLIFAALAIIAPALTILPLGMRAFKNEPPGPLCKIWATTILAHTLTAIFLLQSDAHIVIRILLTFIPLAAITVATIGWRADSGALKFDLSFDQS
ncbi:hypothetical protein V2O64_21150 [Verrucomicrobiaceae bacterium 227]